MSPEIDFTVGEVRSKYAFLFSSIAELYRLYYGTKPSTKFEDVKKAANHLIRDSHLSEYLKVNLESVFDLYSSLLPSVVVNNFKKDEQNEHERLNKLGALVDILIGDVCGEINEKVQQSLKYDRDSLLNKVK